jgi:hypothetical protein
MITRTIPRIQDLAVPMTPPEDLVRDDDYLPGTEDWAVLESLRSSGDDAQERDAEDERFVALMIGGDAFD